MKTGSLVPLASAALALCAGLFVTSPAFADAPLKPADQTRAIVRDVADCVVDYDTVENGGRGLAAYFAGKSRDPQLRGYITECVKANSFRRRWISQSEQDNGLLRGEMARSIVANDWGGELPAVMHQMALTGTDDPVRAYGVCVAKADPVHAREAVSAPVASERETAAYAALAPALSACLTKGKTLSFTKLVLEGALAEGLFAERFGGEPETNHGTSY